MTNLGTGTHEIALLIDNTEELYIQKLMLYNQLVKVIIDIDKLRGTLTLSKEYNSIIEFMFYNCFLVDEFKTAKEYQKHDSYEWIKKDFEEWFKRVSEGSNENFSHQLETYKGTYDFSSFMRLLNKVSLMTLVTF